MMFSQLETSNYCPLQNHSRFSRTAVSVTQIATSGYKILNPSLDFGTGPSALTLGKKSKQLVGSVELSPMGMTVVGMSTVTIVALKPKS
jgi:hypothetical protein